MMTTIRRSVAAAILAFLACSTAGSAQEARVLAGPAYGAGGAKAWLLGDDYRDLWLTPITVPVLDLRSYGGGLTPLRRGGGRQTASLRLLGADGREYSFRSVNKVPWMAQDPDLRGALLADLIQDQVSSLVPAAPMMAASLARAAGVLTATPALYVMPDDPALGEFRQEFAGMLGTLEERADEAGREEPGFGGFTRIESTEDMLDELEEDPTQSVDERAYLTARLLDILMGDWDRHEDQWRWARVERGGGTVWVPIARDHDFAFADYDGKLLDVARRAVPNAVRFRGDYGRIEGLVMNAAGLDRQLLSWLERPVWDSAAIALRNRITDEAIDAAVGVMPPEYRALRGAELTALLRERRDRLPVAASAYYLHLARAVEIRATDVAERAEIERFPDGGVEVRLHAPPADGRDGMTRRRLFRPEETREIRLFLRGGDDVAVVSGSAARGILVRVIGGGGSDELTDASSIGQTGRWTSLHDSDPRDRLRGGAATTIDRRPYTPPETTPRGLIRIPPPEFGTRTSFRPLLDYSTTTGLIAGAGFTRTRHAFRRHPHAERIAAGIRYSPRWGAFGLDASGRFQGSDPALSTSLRLTASQLEAIRFYGFGNETAAVLPAADYVVRRDLLDLRGTVRREMGGGISLAGGPLIRASRPRPVVGSPAADDLRGGEGWSALGGAGAVELEHASGEDLHLRFTAGASALQGLGRLEDPFGDLHATAGIMAPIGPGWTALRGGVHGAWGRYPFDQAAFLGGRESLRGYPEWRFAGDVAVHGTAEAGVRLGRLPLVMNWRTALFGFVDAGRVFLDDERSGRWHAAPGAGVQLDALDLSLRLTYAHGEHGRVYLETRRDPTR